MVFGILIVLEAMAGGASSFNRHSIMEVLSDQQLPNLTNSAATFWSSCGRYLMLRYLVS
jgi:hypothetical protein